MSGGVNACDEHVMVLIIFYYVFGQKSQMVLLNYSLWNFVFCAVDFLEVGSKFSVMERVPFIEKVLLNE